jgi:polyhydroxyalkanoate synthesis regulator phasin
LGLRSEVAALRADIAALRADSAGTAAHVDALAENVAAINAMIVRHGRAIEVLMQDVGLMRGAMATKDDITLLRAEIREIQQEAADRHEIANARHAELLAAIASLRPA